MYMSDIVVHYGGRRSDEIVRQDEGIIELEGDSLIVSWGE